MKTLDLTLSCERAYIRHSTGSIEVSLENIAGVDLNVPQIAENVSIGSMIEAHGLTNVLDYLVDEHSGELMAFMNSLED